MAVIATGYPVAIAAALYIIAICAGELESCGDLVSEIESLEMQLTDVLRR